MAFTKRKVQANKAIFILLFLVLSLFVVSCSQYSDGFVLQNFEVSNSNLDSIVNKLSNEYAKNTKNENRKIIVLDFRLIDSIPQFWFSFHTKDDLRDYFIFYQNRRIIGYLTKSYNDIILLSDINAKNKFEDVFSNFIYPTKKKKRFDFLYFPDNQYNNDSTEVISDNGAVAKEYSWPNIVCMRDYAYIQYKFINDEFVNVK